MLVENFEPIDYLDKNRPNLVFLHKCVFFFVFGDTLVKIAIVNELHNDAANDVNDW